MRGLNLSVRSSKKFSIICAVVFLISLKLIYHYNDHIGVSVKKAIPSCVDTNFHLSTPRYDKERIIKIYEWAWKAATWDKLMEDYDVCLATQSSIDRIWSIEEVAENWKGPISLAVYLSKPAEWSILKSFVHYMARCSQFFGQTVSIQIAIPANASVLDFRNVESAHGNFTCHKPKEYLQLLMKAFLPAGRDETILYPQNHMRNIARKTCGTAWVYLTDVDIIPKSGSASALHDFRQTQAVKNCSKCAYVIPTYELDPSVTYPQTKKELINYSNIKLARQFHVTFFRAGHGPTDYDKWSKYNLAEEPVKISHTVDRNKIRFYEPFYASPDNIPPHDERFLGYGFVRNSQVAESNLTGWRFKVLTPIYAIHWGLQTPKTLIAPTLRSGKNLRDQQKYRNYKLYKNFIAELKAKIEIVENLRRTKEMTEQKDIDKDKGKI